MSRLARVSLAVLAVAAATASLAVAAPRSGGWKGNLYTGKGARVPHSVVSLSVSHGKVRHFVVSEAAAACFEVGYGIVVKVTTIAVPSITIHGSKFSTTYHFGHKAVDIVTGRFSGNHASGTVRQREPQAACDTYTLRWSARPR